jgi:GTP-binding protein HflX
MNRLSKSDVFAENKLFATLDTTVRKVVFGTMPFLLSDTVGFIRKLPTHLVESFKSTLDEVRESDVMIHVVDLSHPQFEDHVRTVESTLNDLGIENKPVLLVFNKVDLYREKYFDKLLDRQTKEDILDDLKQSLRTRFEHPCVFISAHSGENMDVLREEMTKMIKDQYQARYPYLVKQFWT